VASLLPAGIGIITGTGLRQRLLSFVCWCLIHRESTRPSLSILVGGRASELVHTFVPRKSYMLIKGGAGQIGDEKRGA
jgi:hypothetical protein